MTHFIVGGSGFIGTRLANRLSQAGTEFVIYDKAASADHPDAVRLGDVRDAQTLSASMPPGATIIHLAAEHRDDVRPVSLYQDVNVGGAIHLCAAARQREARTIVFTSSVAVYGFAPIGTDEDGQVAPFNEYGRTKHEAEQVLRAWQAEAPDTRCLVIIRPTVVFGERNRGNVYNLLRQIASGRFVMVGHGENRKSMAYVENVAAFIEYSTRFGPGVHTYNFIDKPDFTMNQLVAQVRQMLGRGSGLPIRLPYALGHAIGRVFDGVAALTGKRFAISAIRVRKFCADSVYNSRVPQTGFVAPVALDEALRRTIAHEFLEQHEGQALFYSE